MSTFDQLCDDVLQTLYGYGLAQPRASFLNGGIDADDLQITVNDASNFEQGIAEIGNEIVFIESIDAGNNTLTISPDGRGYYGSTAATHATSARITMSPTWSRTRVAGAVNEAILGVFPTLFGVATTSFTYNPTITTYELPALCERVLQVTCDTLGPSNEQLELNRYRFNSTATGSDFATGNSITLEKGPMPGRSVNVTYKKALTELTFGQAFTLSGLRESAKLCIKYAACSTLIAFMDSSRLPVDTAQADEYDPSRNGVGTASRTSAQLYQRYLVELDNERKRLLQNTPSTISVRTR